MTDPTTNLDISNFPVFVPALTIEKYAYSLGVTPHVVEAWIKNKKLKSVKIGRRRLINLVSIMNELQE